MNSCEGWNRPNARPAFSTRCCETIRPRSLVDQRGYFPDIMPTLAELIGNAAAVPIGVDGISLAPTLRGDVARQRPPGSMIWEFTGYGGQQAVIEGDWKGIRRDLNRGNTAIELYHLEDDPGERHDLAAAPRDRAHARDAHGQGAYTVSFVPASRRLRKSGGRSLAPRATRSLERRMHEPLHASDACAAALAWSRRLASPGSGESTASGPPQPSRRQPPLRLRIASPRTHPGRRPPARRSRCRRVGR